MLQRKHQGWCHERTDTRTRTRSRTNQLDGQWGVCGWGGDKNRCPPPPQATHHPKLRLCYSISLWYQEKNNLSIKLKTNAWSECYCCLGGEGGAAAPRGVTHPPSDGDSLGMRMEDANSARGTDPQKAQGALVYPGKKIHPLIYQT